MAASSITANTATMRATAEGLKGSAKNYLAAYEAMERQIQSLRNSWTSEDGDKYIAKIETYRDSFIRLNQSLISCADSIIMDATNYENALKANMTGL